MPSVDLLSPGRIDGFDTRNRMFMAPMTRSRARPAPGEDPETLADMVLAASNEALRAAAQAVEAKLRGQLPDLGALGLPGM